MSGIAGAATLDGAPVDAGAVRGMAAALEFRGPDGGGVWMGGEAALAHALLARTPSPGAGTGPRVLGGAVLACDARLDGRDDLLRRLRGAGRSVSAADDDAELILHAYHAWGTRCVDHLLGDFAFALWDAPRKRLFCARDPFGVRPFFYGVAGRTVVFGNTLQALQRFPGLDLRADDCAVGRYLVHGWHHDPEATYFRGIRTLPGAHTLGVEDGRVAVARYWELPVDEELRYRRPGDYLDRFEEVMGAAVADRVPTRSASLLMSGGRDSTAVAATLRRVRGAEVSLRAFTAVYDRLMPDEERRYSTIAARALDIPIQHYATDDVRLMEGWDHPVFRRPEPLEVQPGMVDTQLLGAMAAHSRTGLTGFGADAVFFGSRSRLVKLALGGHPLRALAESARYVRWHRRLPRPGVRTWLRDRAGKRSWTPPFPVWLAPDLVERCGLRESWEARLNPPASPHPRRPEAYTSVTSPFWSHLFAGFDPGATHIPIQVAHPFMDVRLVRFLLAVPPAQWLNDKGLLRATMRHQLPAEFLRRQKTPLAGDPVRLRLQERGRDALARRSLAPGIERYVDPDRLPRFAGGRAPDGPLDEAWLHLRPLALSAWMDPDGAGEA